MVGPPFDYSIAMNKQLFDLFAFGLGALTLGVVVFILTNIEEHRREYPKYRAASTPPGAPPPGNYRQFVRLWRKHRHNFERSPRKQTLTLGEYLRLCELEAERATQSPARLGK